MKVNYISQSLRDKLGFFLVVATFIILLAMKIAWGVFDNGCPTFTLNMINQIKSGKFPASFPAAPDIPANYHQAHLIISAIVSNIFHLDSLQALKIFILFFSVIGFSILAQASRRSMGNFFGPITVLTCYVASSFPNSETWTFTSKELDWYEYLSLFQYLVSPSWPLTIFFCSLTLVRITGEEQLMKRMPLLLIILIPVNATAFSILFSTYLIYLSFQTFESFRKSRSLFKYLTQALILFAIYLLKGFTVSAFKVGVDYEQPAVSFRPSSPGYWGFQLFYLNLQTPLILIGFAVIARMVLNRYKGVAWFFVLLFLTSFSFPVIFKLNGVDDWDNSHKFVVLTSFSSILLLIKYFEGRSTRFRLKKNYLLILLAVVLIAAPSNFNDVTSRSNPALSYLLTKSKNTELSDFLNKSSSRKMIWVYHTKDFDFCGNGTLNETSAAAAGYYGNNFLLSNAREKSIEEDRIFFEKIPYQTLKRNSALEHIVIVSADKLRYFEKEETYLARKFNFYYALPGYYLFKFNLS